MTKRPLTEEEKGFTLKAIENSEKELKTLNYELKVNELYLSEGLDLNYAKKKDELTKHIHSTKKAIEETLNIVNVWKGHVLDGVEVKENVENISSEAKLEGENQ